MRPDGSVPAHTSIFVFEIQLQTTGSRCSCVQYPYNNAAVFSSDVLKWNEIPRFTTEGFVFLPAHMRFGDVWD